MYTLVFRPKAKKSVESLRKFELLRIMTAFAEIQRKGASASSVKVLLGISRGFRKRVGRWRVLFTVDEEKKKVTVWIVAIEKDTKRDYGKWVRYIKSNLL